MKIFCVSYEYYEIDKPELSVGKMIGFYSSYDECLNALIRCKDQVEFSNNLESLLIESMIFNDNIDNNWTGGFIVVGDDE